MCVVAMSMPSLGLLLRTATRKGFGYHRLTWIIHQAFLTTTLTSHYCIIYTIIIVLLLPVFARSNTTTNEEFLVAGYLPDYRNYININVTSLHLTDVMLFSLTPEAVNKYSDSSLDGCCLSEKHYALLREARSYKLLKQPKTRLRLLITIGGAGRSDGFANIVTGSSSTKLHFLEKLIKICQDNDFDGIDFDFENIQTYEQWESYLQLLVQASTFLHEHNLLATVALHPGQFLPERVCQSLDRVHVMAYDMITQSQNSPTKHHASFQSVKHAMSSFTSYGCPSSKLIMGLPAYARHESNPGLVKTYEEVINDFISDQEDEQIIDLKSTINLLNSWKGYRFDSASDVKEKCEYAKHSRFGGVFVWEIGQDKRTPEAGGGILLASASSVAPSVAHSGQMQHENDDAMKEEL